MTDVEAIAERLRARGLRVTPQRQVVFGLLDGNQEHPTVEALFGAAREALPTISLKTVYQTVHELEDLGEVRLLDVGTGAVRVDPNVEHPHHHLICTECGSVRDVLVDVGDLHLAERDRQGFVVRDVQVLFRGECAVCVPAPGH